MHYQNVKVGHVYTYALPGCVNCPVVKVTKRNVSRYGDVSFTCANLSSLTTYYNVQASELS